MNIEKKLEGDTLTLKVAGRLDTNTSPQLESELSLDGVKSVVFDLANLEYVSSAGLRIFLAAQKSTMAAGGGIVIKHPNETVKGVLDITGCSDIFTIEM